MSDDSGDEAYEVSPHDRQYQRLLTVIGKPNDKRKVGKAHPDDVGKPEEESGTVKPSELIRSLKRSTGFGELKKQLGVSTKRNKLLPPPVHRQQKDRIQRAVAYDEAKKNIAIWDPVVNHNRSADHLSFPLNQLPYQLKTVEAEFSDFQPKTSLEIETAKLLQGSKHSLTNHVVLTAAEEEALQAMSLVEANERRAQLQKMRALISYKEQKFRRQKQIKSKKFHRLEKRRKRKDLIKEFEELKTKDPIAAAAKLQLIEMDRIEERVTLKHRNTGKWAKQIQLHAKRDPKTKEALQAQLRISRELLEKKTLQELQLDDQQPTPAIADDIDEGDLTSTDTKNPWMKASFLRGECKKGGVVESTVSADQLRLIQSSQSAPFDTLGEEKFEEAADRQSAVGGSSSAANDIDEIFDRDVQPVRSERRVKSRRKRKEKLTTPDDDFLPESLRESRSDQRGAEVVIVAKAKSADIDPNAFLTTKTQTISTRNPTLREHLDEEVDVDDVPDLIAEAFADDDVVAQFEEEQREAEGRGKAAESSSALPGWGSWTGPDGKADRRKNKRFPSTLEPVGAKKPRFTPGVIISESADQSIRRLQVSDVPFPFTSVGDFEASIRHPLGREWNTETSHKLMVEPPITTRIGTIIAPIDKQLIFKRKRRRETHC